MTKITEAELLSLLVRLAEIVANRCWGTACQDVAFEVLIEAKRLRNTVQVEHSVAERTEAQSNGETSNDGGTSE